MKQHNKKLTRRKVIQSLGLSAMAIPALHLLGCGKEDGTSSATDMGDDMSSEDMNAAADMGSGEDAGQDQGEVSGVGWATGGTAAMVALANYPDPFASESASTCTLTCAATIGPCHTTSPEQVDVSDGWDGLPVRLALRVVNEECEPVEGVILEIWHTNHEGIYSGDITDMCNDVEEYKPLLFFRGYQRTDADGRVYFNTCYPGWYTSRVVHIHFRIMTGDYDASDSATAEVISQLFFTDELNSEIFTEHEKYKEYGLPDTQLDTDNVVGGEDDPSPYILDIEKMEDGVMLASKTIVLQSSSDSSCTMSGAGGGGGMMGGPPGGF